MTIELLSQPNAAQWRSIVRMAREHTDRDGSLHQRTVRESDSAIGPVISGHHLELAEAAYARFVQRWSLLTPDQKARALREAHGS